MVLYELPHAHLWVSLATTMSVFCEWAIRQYSPLDPYYSRTSIIRNLDYSASSLESRIQK